MILDRLARAAIWAAALIYGAAFVLLASRRVFYAGELDFIEGVMMDHVVRLVEGRSIYVEPSLEFIPLAYMPGFAFTASLAVRALGPELWVPRLVSFGAACLLALLLGFVLQRETRSRTLAVAGPGLFLASFGVTGGYYDVARPDSLMLLLAFGGLALLRFTSTRRGAVAAALVLTLAFFTKQHAVWFTLAALAYLFTSDRARLLPFGAVVVAGCAGGFFALSGWLGPWFSYFTWEVPSHWSGIDRGRIVGYIGYQLLGRFGVFSALILLSLALPGRPWSGPRRLWAWVGLGGLATGLMATLDPHAYTHVMNPTVVTLAVLGPLALHQLQRQIEAGPGAAPTWRGALLWLVLLAQFVPLYYGARGMVPPKGSAQARDELVQRLASYPGRVMMIYHGDYARRAGKGTSLQIIPFDDIVRAWGNRLLRDDPEFVDRMFEPLRSGPDRPVLVCDDELAESGAETNPWWREIAPSYVLLETLGELGEKLTPLVGVRATPRYVYVPRERIGEFTPRDAQDETASER